MAEECPKQKPPGGSESEDEYASLEELDRIAGRILKENNKVFEALGRV